ncbi:5844_t:CDS:2 [Funneliformis geosporum]|nr:5844_t:CDS:2 [Funneliformis geosporum]
MDLHNGPLLHFNLERLFPSGKLVIVWRLVKLCISATLLLYLHTLKVLIISLAGGGITISDQAHLFAIGTF